MFGEQQLACKLETMERGGNGERAHSCFFCHSLIVRISPPAGLAAALASVFGKLAFSDFLSLPEKVGVFRGRAHPPDTKC